MIQFTVPDMTCGSCASRISRALQQSGLPSDAQVEIDVAQRQVRLTHGANAQTAQRVRAAIEAAGYTPEASAPKPVTAAGPRTGGCCCASRQAQKPAEQPQDTAPTQTCCR